STDVVVVEHFVVADERDFVVISHTDIALTRIVFDSAAIDRRAFSGSRRSPSSHQSSVCVSSSRRMITPSARSLPAVAERRTPRHLCPPAHCPEASSGPLCLDTREPRDRCRPPSDNHFLAAFRAL